MEINFKYLNLDYVVFNIYSPIQAILCLCIYLLNQYRLSNKKYNLSLRFFFFF